MEIGDKIKVIDNSYIVNKKTGHHCNLIKKNQPEAMADLGDYQGPEKCEERSVLKIKSTPYLRIFKCGDDKISETFVDVKSSSGKIYSVPVKSIRLI